MDKETKDRARKRTNLNQDMMQLLANLLQTGFTQIECRSSIKQDKPLILKNKKVKSKFQSKKIMLITEFGDMKEDQEWTEKIETEAKQTKTPVSSPDF
jgi:hypothetical protein